MKSVIRWGDRQADAKTTETIEPNSTQSQLAYCKIFPPLGIARLGNSPDHYFVGPEIPGRVPDNNGTYKDPTGRVKRQAARFRVYGFNEEDEVVAELNVGHGEISSIVWSVNLANSKAEWWQFDGTANVARILGKQEPSKPRRNLDVKDRRSLIIGPATAKVEGANQTSQPLEGAFQGHKQPIYLGEIKTDSDGHLIVLGGRGESGTVLLDNPLSHYANNDGWFDDTSDGPVTATVTLKDGRDLPLRGSSWVVIAPPHFSPYTQCVVTLYDVMLQAALENDLNWPPELGPRPTLDGPVSFTQDVYPILYRLAMYQWVSDRARRGHTAGKRGDFLNPSVLATLADEALAREEGSPHSRIFQRLRTPILHPPGIDSRQPSKFELHPHSQDAINQANLHFMPPLAGDEGDVTHPLYGDSDFDKETPGTWLSLTAFQYRKLHKWRSGEFTNDWPESATPPLREFASIPLPDRPAALTRASLEACHGGAFFPGIEITSVVRFPIFYCEAFRPNENLLAGDLTKWMALPWQADFYECRDHWWPAVRPDDVIPEHEYQRIAAEFREEVAEGRLSSLLVAREAWTRGLALTLPARPAALPEATGETTLSEYQRAVGAKLAKYLQSYLAVLPKPEPNERADQYLRRLQMFLERTILGPAGFHLPPVESDLQSYFRLASRMLEERLKTDTSAPEPLEGETLLSYAERLNESAASNAIWQGLLDVEWRRRVRHQGKNDMVDNWSRLGFVVSRQTAGENVYIETDRKRFDLLGFRDYFYYLMNLESYPEFLPKARELADEYFRLAEELEPTLRTDPLYEEYGFFEYNAATFTARLEKIYEKQRRDAEIYNPATGEGEPLFRTSAQVVERIRQLAPFNQLDGSWLEKIAQAGPNNEVQGFLFEIWSDEIGNGDPAQNHANIYTDLLRSAGIYLPPLASRTYSTNPEIWDSSFSSPVYQTAAAQFPETYFPELLGMTLYLEWEAVYLAAMVRLYDYHGYNSLFYRLHVAIDNPSNGHGAKARDAVANHLDHVREESGESEMQEHWRRIWNGYLAFKFIGGGDWQYFFTNPPTVLERVVAMLQQKRHFAQLNHGVRRFGANSLNDWFDEIPDFLFQLVQSDLVTPGDAKSSRFFDTMSFTGPMLKVFSLREKELLAEWINSMPQSPLGGGLGVAEAMRVLVSELTARGMAVVDHDGFLLTGAYIDPAQPEEPQVVTKPVSWWFQIDQPERLMAALADPANGWIVPGRVSESRFVTELLATPRRMSRFLIQTVPQLGDRTARQVIIEWIEAGCPIPVSAFEEGAMQRPDIPMPARTNVRADAPDPTSRRTEPNARQIQDHSINSVPLTGIQRRAMRQRFYGPGGGACH